MKNVTILIIILFPIIVTAQTYDVNGEFKISGNLGLGTVTPLSKIHISSIERESLRLYKYGNSTNYLNLWHGTGGVVLDPIGTGQLWIGYDQPANVLIGISPNGNISSGKLGIGTNTPMSKIHINSSARESLRIYNDGNINKYLSFWQGLTGSILDPIGTGQLWIGYDQPTNVLIGVNSDGSVSSGSLGIGTTTTGSHKLAVEGSIGAREILVEATGWSDFVFEEGYNLLTLEDIEKHIAENGRLPEIPSESEIIENGINLGEMDTKLLQKIEELTLYLIEEHKNNKKLQEEVEQLKKKVQLLENE
ncbi:MAG: hypothetical protein WBA74_23865 [Cyclobacteriaceae bacterium]